MTWVPFLVACETKDEVDAFWTELSKGGTVLMPLDEYPSKHEIIPHLWFDKEAKDTAKLYTSLFEDSVFLKCVWELGILRHSLLVIVLVILP